MPKQPSDTKPDAPAFRNDAYRQYMREYMKAYRARKRAESLRRKPEQGEASDPMVQEVAAPA